LPKYPEVQREHEKPLIPEWYEIGQTRHEYNPLELKLETLPEKQSDPLNALNKSTTFEYTLLYNEPSRPPAKNTSPCDGSEAAARPWRPSLRPVANAVHVFEFALYTSTTREEESELSRPPAKNTSPWDGSEVATRSERPTLRLENHVHVFEFALNTTTVFLYTWLAAKNTSPCDGSDATENLESPILARPSANAVHMFEFALYMSTTLE
jgi:hypothetical protein